MFATDTKCITPPFPISKMPHHHYETLVFFCKLVKNGQCFGFKPAMLHHIFCSNGKRFKSLQEKVTEITVKPGFYFPDLFALLFRKRPGKIQTHYFPPVPDHMIEQGINAIRKKKQQGKGQC